MKLTNTPRSLTRPPFITASRRQPHERALSLIEMMVYIGVFAILTSVGSVAFYRCMDNSRALHRNVDDIVDALHAGENWRLDIRAAQGNIRLETNETDQILYLPGPHEVSYRFATNTVFRRLGRNEWSPVLSRVENSAFIADSRKNVPAWRWELEMQTRTKRLGRLEPLFTFLAVPSTQ